MADRPSKSFSLIGYGLLLLVGLCACLALAMLAPPWAT